MEVSYECFRQHELSNCHEKAVEKIITLPATTLDVGEMLSKAHAKEKSKSCQVLLTILSNLRFLVRQACAIWGDGNENDSNFIQLLKLHGEDNSMVSGPYAGGGGSRGFDRTPIFVVSN